jgi:formimidoylglutamate deiminase
LARPIGRLAPGAHADLIVVDDKRPALSGRSGDLLLDALVFAGNENPVTDVMVGGTWAVRAARHPREDEVFSAYKAAVRD